MKKRSFFSYLCQKFFYSKIEFNYIFFGFFFLFILGLNIYHVFVISSSRWITQFFFLFYTIGQTLLELALLLIISVWIKKRASKGLYLFSIACMSLFLFVQLAEFILVRIMDVSFREALSIAFGADLKNFIELLYLSDIGLSLWGIIFSLIVFVPAISLLFYYLSSKLVKKKPIAIKSGVVTYAFCLIPLMLLGVDCLFSYHLLNEDYLLYRKALPWKMTFLEEHAEDLYLESPLSFQVNRDPYFEDMEELFLQTDKRANIYLFVVESLREDFLSDKVAPNLVTFKKEHMAAQRACASSNGTQVSWFSIFHSLYPLYWSYKQNQNLSKGSLPLFLLKKMGYKIQTLTSAELNYFGLKEAIFGKDGSLCDHYKNFPHRGNIGAEWSDISVMQSLKEFVESKHGQEGNVFIVFLDSTHFTYSWPKEMKVPFQALDQLDFSYYLTSDHLKLEAIKNRYKNSIFFVDHLFGDFISFLKKKELYEESIILFTGDHGEEFKEKGKLFHASNLSTMQVYVPLYFKMGQFKQDMSIPIASHVDIFPTLLHYLTGSEKFNDFFHGRSILSKNHKPYALSARYNSCYHPFEFVLDNGERRLHLRFPTSGVYQNSKVKLLALQDKEREIKPTKSQAMQHFSQAFYDLFYLKN